MNKRSLMFVFGTRPEAIKLAPVVLEARKRSDKFDTRIVVTAQHREMLDDVLAAFSLIPDEDLNIMAPGQSLFHITSRVFSEMEHVIERHNPDVIIVQGDTTTTFAGAVAGFYARRKIAHVEAGLRTFDKWAPYPEEMNRKMTSAVTDYHFPPTERARENLLKEGYDDRDIYVTGNTVIDALYWMVERQEHGKCPIPEYETVRNRFSRMALITGHRRENFGAPFEAICNAFRRLAEQNPDVCFMYPVHLNPNVQRPVKSILNGLDNFLLIEPLGYPAFVWAMKESFMIITDSGGVQEEAPALSKPVLVTRRVTERPEAVEAGAVKLVGDDPDAIFENAQKLLRDESFYRSMAQGISPYGDGHASSRILDVLERG